jgi:long-chain acyl-CoA synthetase
MVQQSADIYGDLDAFLVKNNSTGQIRNVSFRQFQNDILYLGTSLCQLGLKDRMIAIVSENRYEWCVSYLAIVNGTGVVVPMDKELPEHELLSLFERSEAGAVLCSQEYAELLKLKRKDLKHLVHIISFDQAKAMMKFCPSQSWFKTARSFSTRVTAPLHQLPSILRP